MRPACMASEPGSGQPRPGRRGTRRLVWLPVPVRTRPRRDFVWCSVGSRVLAQLPPTAKLRFCLALQSAAGPTE
jgi:hypothetical protein